MNKEQLKQLKYLKNEIRIVENQIDNLECSYVTDSVRGSSSHFPYVERKFTIEGVDEGEYSRKLKRLQNKLKTRKEKLIDLKEEINDFIENTEDSLVRQILTLRFDDGLGWEEVANELGQGYTKDSVRMICNRFLEKM